MENEKLLLMASAVSVQQQQSMAKNDVFMLVRFLLVDTLPNLNRQGVTQGFVNDMIARRDQLIGLPLYCDVERLLQHDYEHLGHMLDDDGVFHSTQIGSLVDFELVNDGGVSAIFTTARIPKRQTSICECLIELYNMDSLKFSFQISYNPAYTVEKDGVLYVDKSDDNSLTGVALVSIPANPNSCALQMVAEKAEATEGVENEMDIKEMEAALAEKDAIIAERDAKIEQLNKAIAAKSSEEQEVPSDEKEKEEEVVAECKKDAEAECKKEVQAECKKDAEAECKKEDATAEKEDPEQMKDEEKEQEAVAEQKKEACAQVAVASPYEMECMQQEINRLRVELAGAAAAKAELEAIKSEMAAKELEREQAMAKAFAEKQGLDSEDQVVSKAIAELDYKMIAELTMKNDKPVEKEQRIVVASIAGNGFEICGGKWDDLLASRK